MIGANGIAVLAAAPERVRSRDTLFIYRPDSDFYYLTGFPEPEAVAVLVPGRPQGEFLMFCRERNPERELWDGPRAGPEGAVAAYGADDAFPIDDLDDILPGLLERSDRVYYSIGKSEFDQKLLAFIQTLNAKRQSSHAPSDLVALDHLLHEMRLFKSRGEAGTMRRSAKIAVAAHARAMQAARPGHDRVRARGRVPARVPPPRRATARTRRSSRPARTPACCTTARTTRSSQDGDLVLIDAGCELEMYASDITRTFPVNGRVQRAAARALRGRARGAGAPRRRPRQAGNHWNDPHDAAVARDHARAARTSACSRAASSSSSKSRLTGSSSCTARATGSASTCTTSATTKLGEQWRLLEPGMVMTIEPGIYVSPANKDVTKRWRGIGIRIEDDVLVTREGPDVLTADLAASVEEIEALMAARA